MQFITFDARQLRRLELHGLPAADAWETPGFELHSEVVTPCPHHPIGAKGIGECAAVAARRPSSTRSMDALSAPASATSTCRLLPDRVWEAITYRRDVSGRRRCGRTTDMKAWACWRRWAS
jgi:Aerobic-type carbon monoxide dehydrogenase, large subunit CoxL/CutL homologs